MGKENLYRNLAIVLGIVAIVFIVLYFTKNDEASESVGDASSKLTECKDNIATWQAKYKTGPVSADAQGELSGIIEECSSTI